MTAIPDSVYTTLTPAERIRAAISASARQDTAELDRLRTTCRMRQFKITDPDYSEPLVRLSGLLMAHECEQRGLALSFLSASRVGDEEDATERLAARATSDAALEQFAINQDSLAAFAANEGIDAADLRAMGPPPHPLVAVMAELAEGMAEVSIVAEAAAELSRYFHGEA